MHSDIDFVILWVNPNDFKWQIEKSKFSSTSSDDVGIVRYQDWDNLVYWFRAVEKYAPWVRKIHLVTCGQIPIWLDLDNPKIHLVKHADYMPQDALPVFNSSAIEIGIHRIPELAEKFVFFNDDMILTDYILPDYYFKDNIPVDLPGFIASPRKVDNNIFSSLMINNNNIIRKYFSKKDILSGRLTWWFRPTYGKIFIRNVIYSLKKDFPGFIIPHLSTPYLKSDFEKVWEKEKDILAETQYHRFRNEKDVTHFLIRNWRMCEGCFYPDNAKGKYFSINDVNDAIKAAHAILHNKYSEICFNETCSGDEFENSKSIINAALHEQLPQKCMFEK